MRAVFSTPPSSSWQPAPISSGEAEAGRIAYRGGARSNQLAEHPVRQESTFPGQPHALAIVLEQALVRELGDLRADEAVEIVIRPQPEIVPVDAQDGPAQHEHRGLVGASLGGKGLRRARRRLTCLDPSQVGA